MTADLLDDARQFLAVSLRGKRSDFETRHPWRKEWEFAILHSLRVEAYTLKILRREQHLLSEAEIRLLRLAAILHDIARMDDRDRHAESGAQIAADWLQSRPGHPLNAGDIERVTAMIANHSDKSQSDSDYCQSVLKDADTLDEIGALSVFMAANWLDHQSPFFFHNLRQRLIEIELPFCDRKFSLLNTAGGRAILLEKKAFIERFIAQLADELEMEEELVLMRKVLDDTQGEKVWKSLLARTSKGSQG